MIEISKELLSEIIGKEIREFAIEKNELRYIYQDDTKSIPDLYFINIYELAHKCKEWLKNNVSNANSGFNNAHMSFCYIENYNIQDIFYADTEVEAIIKACTYILNNLSNK